MLVLRTLAATEILALLLVMTRIQGDRQEECTQPCGRLRQQPGVREPSRTFEKIQQDAHGSRQASLMPQAHQFLRSETAQTVKAVTVTAKAIGAIDSGYELLGIVFQCEPAGLRGEKVHQVEEVTLRANIARPKLHSLKPAVHSIISRQRPHIEAFREEKASPRTLQEWSEMDVGKGELRK
eukprot:CAMPEP_0180423588 /NCGR_PEP_ID=MMETSP1036_2-20121128/4295_1 /TAXON_ID=632150 /ORGANISM="Azadinium spinosum, Strain 3D9" /LENGTH=180 /DNA_ID=CAMNT_0022428991 /DNA_START=211 /DNA_END=754 /DNA_ORIENTATION=+